MRIDHISQLEGSKGGCFPKYAKVSTPDGYKYISELIVGEEVISFDESGALTVGVVTKVTEHSSDKVYRLSYWGGHIDVTSNHWMLNQFNTFALAGSLAIDDALVDANGHLRPIKSVAYLEDTKVYNISVSPHATFICQDIRVHNGGTGLGVYRDFLEGNKGGDKGGGGSTYVPTEAPNTLSSNTVARVADAISDGEIEGFLDGLKSVVLNGTRLQNTDDTYNFNGVVINIRYGVPDQEYLPGFAAVESEIGVGVEIEKGTPVVRTINDSNATSALVKIRLSGLTKQSTNGDLSGSSVELTFEIQTDGGGYELARQEVISGKTTTTYETAYRIELPQGGSTWDIRVSRLTDNSDDDATVNNKTYWSTYTKIIDNKIGYEDTALIGMEIDAKQFSEQVPSRAYEIKGIKVQIPSNYDPIARTYTGLWDGTFIVAWSNNPAWVLYDLLTNSRYGVGDSIDASQVDKFALYEIARYCDELVPDGDNGYEPRYTFNAVIGTQEEAYKVLASIVSNFNGMLYWASGLVTATVDRDADPVKLITPANVIGGVIEYTGSSLKTRYSVAIVRWNDPEDEYRSVPVAVEDSELIELIGWKATDLIAYGCTSKGQAIRKGKYFLDTEKNAKDIVKYRASFDNADLLPGDIIAVADPTYAGVRFGGRLVSATTTSVTIDSPIVLNLGQTYQISLQMPNGTILDRDITNSADGVTEHSVLSFSELLPSLPNMGSMWIVTGSDIAPRLFRVISLSEVEKNIYEVSGLAHDPTKYLRVEQDIQIAEPTYTLLPTGKLGQPTELSAQEYLYRANNGVIQGGVTFSCRPPNDPRVSYYQFELMKPDTDFYITIGTPSDPSVDVGNISSGSYMLRIRAVDPFSLKSEYTTKEFVLLGLLKEPSDVTNFKINNIGAQSVVSWTPVLDLDTAGYKIKYSNKSVGATWGESIILADNIPATSGNFTVPTLVGTYLIKAVDSSGVESLNAALIVSNITDASQVNIVAEIQEDTTFLGVQDNITDTGITITLDDLADTGYYYFAYSLDLGDVFTSRIIPYITAFGADASETMASWTTLAAAEFMSTADPASWGASVQVATTNDAPYYSDNNLFLSAELFSDASWTKTQTSVSVSAVLSVSGESVSDVIIEDGSAGAHSVHNIINEDPATGKAFSVWAKADGRDFIRLTIADSDSLGNSVSCVFDLALGLAATIGAAGNGVAGSAAIENFGNGWFRCSVTGTPNTSGSTTRAVVELGQDGTTFSYTGDTVSGVLLWGAELLNDTTIHTATWAAYKDVIVGDYTARAYKFGVLMQSFNGNTAPVISELGVTIDMPDRLISGGDELTDVAGESIIVFASAFKNKPVIQVTGQDMATGDYFTVTNTSVVGFTVNFYDITNTGVQRTFDWVATGYGRKQ